MAISLKHQFVSGKGDSADATLVQPSNWNEEHTLELAGSTLLGRATAGTGVAEEITLGTGLSFVGTVLTPAVDALGTNLDQIKALADPNADRILFWDDSGNAFDFLTAGTGLSISGTTISFNQSGNYVFTGTNTFSGGLTLNSTVTFNDRVIVETNTANWTGSISLLANTGPLLEVTLTGNTTLSDGFADGDSILLQIDDGTAYTITWPTITWVSGDGAAPILKTTGATVISIWKAGTTLYGFASNGA